MRRLFDHKRHRRHVLWASRAVVLGLVFSTLRLWNQAWSEANGKEEDKLTQPLMASSINNAAADTPNHRLLYIGQFGLGHRMSKLSAAIHLAKTIPLSQVEVYFGHCQAERKTRDWDIFYYLFGTNLIQLGDFMPPRKLTLHPSLAEHHKAKAAADKGNTTRKVVLVRNDVPEYYAAQAYKNARLELSRNVGLPAEWADKLETDVVFFRYLIDRFLQRHTHDYQQFVTSTLDDSHFVIGFHVRAGNGESHHFQSAHRGMDPETMTTDTFCSNLMSLVQQALQQESNNSKTSFRSRGQTPVIFLATDTASIIPVFTQVAHAFGISVVTFPQSRLSQDEGVSYATWTKGSKCLEGWKTSLMDMAVLALRADVVVAAMRSTFTQIVPLALQFDRGVNDTVTTLRFCEVSSLASDMTCFASRDAWLLRQGLQSNIVSFSLKNDDTNTTFRHDQSIHKVMVHLPDILNGTAGYQASMSKIRTFLSEPSGDEYYAYGDRINPKYRSKLVSFRSEWAWKG